MNKQTKIISVIAGIVVLTTIIIIAKKRRRQNEENSIGDGTDIVDPYIEIAPTSTQKKYNVPFKNIDEGNAFRLWINRYYPKFAKDNEIDPTGSFNNAYIYKAWQTYGTSYLKSYGYKIPANPKSLGF